MREPYHADVLIIGGGPAGMAAACTAAAQGKSVLVVDDNPALGGQIWRKGITKLPSALAKTWFAQVAAQNIQFLFQTQIVNQLSSKTLLGVSGNMFYEITFERCILCTGARERFLPFPGWTLPQVMGAGGLQALVKGGWPIAGKRVAVAGSGPLLLAVAVYLQAQGAEICLIAEQTPAAKLVRFGLGLWHSPAKWGQAFSFKKALHGVPIYTSCWPVRVTREHELATVTFQRSTDTFETICDYLACGFGLVPNLALPTLMGCAITRGCVAVDAYQETSVKDVYCAGEATGIGGVEKALLEGQVAGYAATGAVEKARKLSKKHPKIQKFVRQLDRAFALRPALKRLSDAETIVCRCEDVTYGALQTCGNARAAKLHTRCGMGPCQGRICGTATSFLFDWEMGTVRPPIFPAPAKALYTHHKS